MQNKLQELTDKLYEQGLSKGKQEAEGLLAKAKAEADKIIADANAQAKKILSDANAQAKELETKSQTDIAMASKQTTATIRQEIENSIITSAVAGATKSALSKVEFITELIKTIVAAFNPSTSEPVALNVLLPEGLQKEFTAQLETSLKDELSKGLEVKFSKQINAGFKIGPAKEGYLIAFTDEDFNNIFSEFLRPHTRKLLFG